VDKSARFAIVVSNNTHNCFVFFIGWFLVLYVGRVDDKGRRVAIISGFILLWFCLFVCLLKANRHVSARYSGFGCQATVCWLAGFVTI